MRPCLLPRDGLWLALPFHFLLYPQLAFSFLLDCTSLFPSLSLTLRVFIDRNPSTAFLKGDVSPSITLLKWRHVLYQIFIESLLCVPEMPSSCIPSQE